MPLVDKQVAHSGKQTHLGDEDMMALVMQGDTAALETLYDRYASAVMGIAVKMLGDRSAAEEIVQETFWRVWHKSASFQSHQGKFVGWLFGIARNLCVDLWRRNQSRPQFVFPDEDRFEIEQEVDPTVDVPERALMQMRGKQVRAAIAGLPQEQRVVLEMAYFAGMTRQKISQETGVPLGTVHTRARLALKKLRQLLDKQGFEYE
ncbi:MAG: sigma-70 family RNA polymerase sigma factor [Chloroflexota bacterium]